MYNYKAGIYIIASVTELIKVSSRITFVLKQFTNSVIDVMLLA